jgi:hypothetical protein
VSWVDYFSRIDLCWAPSDDVVELGHAGFLQAPAVLRSPELLVLRREMGEHVHPGRVEPHEERLVFLLGLLHEVDRMFEDHVVDRLHVQLDALGRMGRERTLVDDLLLAYLAPAGVDRRVVLVGRPTVEDVAYVLILRFACLNT